jgi:hypothetical protein
MMQHSLDLFKISQAIDNVYTVLQRETTNESNGLRQLAEAKNDWKLAFTHVMSMTLK